MVDIPDKLGGTLKEEEYESNGYPGSERAHYGVPVCLNGFFSNLPASYRPGDGTTNEHSHEGQEEEQVAEGVNTGFCSR